MKKTASLFLVLFSMLFVVIVISLSGKGLNAYTNSIPITSDYFPDSNFLKCVKELDSDSNNLISYDEMPYYLTINDEEIGSLEGIQYFDGYLQGLACFSNHISSLDLSQVTSLKYLYCMDNGMTSLDVSGCTDLITLNCSNNSLTTLDLSKNVHLENLNCSFNSITDLDISNCVMCLIIDEYKTENFCEGIHNDYKNLLCDKNVNLKNIPEYMDYLLPNGAIAINQTSFPDPTFRRYVSYSFDHNFDGVLSYEERISVVDMTVMERKVYSLKGIEFFPELKNLDASETSVMKLDLSQNSKLVKFTASFLTGTYGLTELYVDNPELEEICVLCCDLKELDVSACPKLKILNVSRNELTKLDVTKNPELVELSFGGDGYGYSTKGDAGNYITEIDLSNNSKLTSLYCSGLGLSELDVSKLSSLRQLNCAGNNLSSIDISNTELCNVVFDYTDYFVDHDKNTVQSYTQDWSKSLTYDESTTIITAKSEHTVSIEDFEHGNFMVSLLTATEGTTINIYANPYEGYELKKITVKYSEETFDVTITKQFVMPSEDVTVSVEFVPKVYKVVFESNGGTSISSQSICHGSKVVKPTDPTKSGYSFEGWYADSSLKMKYDFNSEVKNDGLKLYAKWNAISPSVKPTSNPTSTPAPTQAPVKEATFEDFVERLYVVALERDSEPDGKAYWCGKVKDGTFDGAYCARFFLTSPEFLGKNKSDGEFVDTLYRTFFGREADDEGRAFWVKKIKESSKEAVVEGFINSEEWCNICASYGVKSGAQWAKASVASKNATDFASRLYTKCLGRDAEEGGLKYWSLALTNLEITGSQAAREFFYSDEFKGFNTSNEVYVVRMYETFMGREPEGEGKAYWIDYLNKGGSRDEMFNFFSTCPEFTEICASYSIER